MIDLEIKTWLWYKSHTETPSIRGLVTYWGNMVVQSEYVEPFVVQVEASKPCRWTGAGLVPVLVTRGATLPSFGSKASVSSKQFAWSDLSIQQPIYNKPQAKQAAKREQIWFQLLAQSFFIRANWFVWSTLSRDTGVVWTGQSGRLVLDREADRFRIGWLRKAGIIG